jgi:hypothetical protein
MKYAGLIVAGICVVLLVKSFVSNTFTPRFLNFEINIWLYRAIWGLMGVYALYRFFDKKKGARS